MQTRILVVIAHFFKEEQNGKYSSTRGDKKSERQTALIQTILGWLSLSKSRRHLDVYEECFINIPNDINVDIVIIKNDNNHLIPSYVTGRGNIKITQVNLENTRYLPFAAHLVMKNNIEKYDWFAYSEDDLQVSDPYFFDKAILFNSKFGNKFVLMPNRFELDLQSPVAKTYVDGFNQTPEFVKVLERMNSVGSKPLLLNFNDRGIKFERAKNPHSGCFLINSTQLKNWVGKSYFGNMDASFVSPLESAATLGIAKTFAAMKPSPENAEWLEIQHLDYKFSRMKFSIV